MEIPENMIAHIRESARDMKHGQIVIKLDETRDIIDVSFTHVTRYYVKKVKNENIDSE